MIGRFWQPYVWLTVDGELELVVLIGVVVEYNALQ
jgi:hypothetical protein